jgi:hypothetical protein
VRKRVSAQVKPISEVVKEFEQSLEDLRPSTKRVYVAGANSVDIDAVVSLERSKLGSRVGNRLHRGIGVRPLCPLIPIPFDSGRVRHVPNLDKMAAIFAKP